MWALWGILFYLMQPWTPHTNYITPWFMEAIPSNLVHMLPMGSIQQNVDRDVKLIDQSRIFRVYDNNSVVVWFCYYYCSAWQQSTVYNAVFWLTFLHYFWNTYIESETIVVTQFTTNGPKLHWNANLQAANKL